MTREEFKEILEDKGYSYKEEGNKIIVNDIGNVDLGSLQTLPEVITFSNGGSVYLESLQTLPEGITFSNDVDVHLGSLKTIPQGITFSNRGFVDLRSLQTIPQGIVFSNWGNVYLGSLIGWFHDWKGNIKGIGNQRLLNKMISLGLFDRK
jgi:hypothetical protein